MSSRRDNSLIMFARDPIPGECKTRLMPELSPLQTVDLYKSFVEDILAKFHDHPAFDFSVYLRCKDAEVDRFWKPYKSLITLQSGDDLGERMYNAFRERFEIGYRRVSVIGSDLPTLSVECVLGAFKELYKNDVVLGPSSDGGYYLIGMTKARKALFENIDWGTSTVWDSTLRVIDQLNLRLATLRTENDIDDFGDLQELMDDIRIGDTSLLASEAPSTLSQIKKLLLSMSTENPEIR